MTRSLLAFFASRFYDERKEHFNLLAERKKKNKNNTRGDRRVSNPREFMHATLNRYLRANPMRHFNHHAFTPFFLKP